MASLASDRRRIWIVSFVLLGWVAGIVYNNRHHLLGFVRACIRASEEHVWDAVCLAMAITAILMGLLGGKPHSNEVTHLSTSDFMDEMMQWFVSEHPLTCNTDQRQDAGSASEDNHEELDNHGPISGPARHNRAAESENEPTAGDAYIAPARQGSPTARTGSQALLARDPVACSREAFKASSGGVMSSRPCTNIHRCCTSCVGNSDLAQEAPNDCMNAAFVHTRKQSCRDAAAFMPYCSFNNLTANPEAASAQQAESKRKSFLSAPCAYEKDLCEPLRLDSAWGCACADNGEDGDVGSNGECLRSWRCISADDKGNMISLDCAGVQVSGAMEKATYSRVRFEKAALSGNDQEYSPNVSMECAELKRKADALIRSFQEQRRREMRLDRILCT